MKNRNRRHLSFIDKLAIAIAMTCFTVIPTVLLYAFHSAYETRHADLLTPLPNQSAQFQRP